MCKYVSACGCEHVLEDNRTVKCLIQVLGTKLMSPRGPTSVLND